MKGEEMTIASRVSALRSTIPGGVKVVAGIQVPSRRGYHAGIRGGTANLWREPGTGAVAQARGAARGYRVAFRWALATQQGEADRSPLYRLIHSVSSERLMREIDKQAAVNNRVIPGLLQIHIAEEESKSGFHPDECRKFLAEGKVAQLPQRAVGGG